MMFHSREDVNRAIRLLDLARADLRRALDHMPGDEFWQGWQEQAQAWILQVSASMDVGGFGLPHPWDLSGWSPASLATQYMLQAMEERRERSGA